MRALRRTRLPGLVDPSAVSTLPWTIADSILWLDPRNGVLKAGGTPCAHGDTVATWEDQTPYGFDFTTGTGSVIYQTNIFKSSTLPGIYFQNAQTLVNSVLDATLSPTNEGTVIIFARINSDTQWGLITLGSCTDGFGRWSGNGNGYAGTMRAARIDSYPSGQPTTGDHIWTFRSGASYYQVRMDKSAYSTQGTQSWGIAGTVRLGNSEATDTYLSGWLGPVGIWKRKLTDGEVVMIENYIDDTFT